MLSRRPRRRRAQASLTIGNGRRVRRTPSPWTTRERCAWMGGIRKDCRDGPYMALAVLGEAGPDSQGRLRWGRTQIRWVSIWFYPIFLPVSRVYTNRAKHSENHLDHQRLLSFRMLRPFAGLQTDCGSWSPPMMSAGPAHAPDLRAGSPPPSHLNT